MILFFVTVLTAITTVIATVVLGSLAVIAAMFGVKDRPGGVYDNVPRWWARAILFVSRTRVVVHGREHLSPGSTYIFVGNHVSWFDVPALSATLPRYKFVAKAELFRVPFFGHGLRAVGMVEIQRENRKAAFESYKIAGERIRQGNSVVVFPEGTRGRTYAIRPFKKGPFVLAIAAGVPIVPLIIHGSLESMPKGSFRVRSGRIDIHLLQPIPTAGLDYDSRDQLSSAVRSRMADAMLREYGIASPVEDIQRPTPAHTPNANPNT